MSNEITIGGNLFTVSPLLGERSFLLQPKIVPALAEVGQLYAMFVEAVVDLAEGGKNADVDVLRLLPKAQPALDRAAPVIGRLCEKLGPDSLREIMRALLAGATIDGRPLYSSDGNPIDVLMRGRTLDLWRLLVFALEVSYPDFFGLLRGLRARAVGGAGSVKSITSDPGPAGDSS